jgi:site-specific DNA-methyltransferase (adenine-specific)
MPMKSRLYRSDCVQGMQKHVKTSTVDVVVTSPPYNLGVGYSSYVDRLPEQEYMKWTLEWASEIARCLAEDGALFLNLGSSPTAPLIPHKIIDALAGDGAIFILQNTIHWIKSIAIPNERGEERQIGHYKPINSPRFVNDCHEYIFHLTKSGCNKIDRKGIGVPYADKSNIQRWKTNDGADIKCRGNTWFIPYKTISRRATDRPHPATFPTELAKNCLMLHGVDQDTIVLDPFLGIGHSAFAAAECGVNEFIGFEIDEQYIDIAARELLDKGIRSKLSS